MNDQDNMNEEMPTVSGCPALGPKVLPSGFDGVESAKDEGRSANNGTDNSTVGTLHLALGTLSRTDYEEVIADLFHKCNEAFIHAPHQREARPMYFKKVVGDIADALASVVPVDNRRRDVPVASDKDGSYADDATRTSRQRENVIYRTPQHIVDFIYETCNVPFADQADPAFLKKIAEKFKLVPVEESKSKVEVEERRKKSLALHDVRGCVAKTPSTVVMNFTLPSGRLISAEIHDESTDKVAEAAIFDGENIVCRMMFFNQYQGRHWMYPIVRRACNGLLSKAGKKCRNLNNKKKEA